MPVILTRSNLLHLNGFTRVERLKSVARMREAIVDSHGWVIDFHLFSNLSICLQFDIPIEHLPLLAESLLDAGIKFTPRSQVSPLQLRSRDGHRSHPMHSPGALHSQ